jgi:flagellar motor component MotA
MISAGNPAEVVWGNFCCPDGALPRRLPVYRVYIIPALFVAALIAVAIVRPEFVDIRSLLLIIGGALTVTFFSCSTEQLRDLANAIVALFKEQPRPLKEYVEELARLTRLFRLEGLKALETQEPLVEDGFVRRGVGLLSWLRGTARTLILCTSSILRCLSTRRS